MGADPIGNAVLSVIVDALQSRGVENSINRVNLELWESVDNGVRFIKSR